MADPYTLLGVARGASDAEIKKAYRKLAKELHPDANKDNPRAADRFSEVTTAYDLLSDATKRGQYDRGEIDEQGNPRNPFAGGGGFDPRGFSGTYSDPRGGFGGARGGAGGFSDGGADFGSIFDDLFGGRSRRAPPPKGGNRAYRLSVGFIDAATLVPQRITLSDGKTIDLKLPKGVENGTQMRLPGRGDPGPGGAGDATVTIEIKPHAFFRRDGADVRVDLPISLVEAVKGAKIKVPTVDGPVMLAIPAGSTSGQTLRLKGKGFSRKDGTRGDQLVSLTLDIPAGDAALQGFVEEWTDKRNIRAALGV